MCPPTTLVRPQHCRKESHVMRMYLRIIPVLTAIFIAAGVVALPALGSHSAAPAPDGKTHTYYVAADEVAWDYAPTGLNQITGLPFDDVANTYVQSGTNRIGRVYL